MKVLVEKEIIDKFIKWECESCDETNMKKCEKGHCWVWMLKEDIKEQVKEDDK